MLVNKEIREILLNSELTSDELRAFETGLSYLSEKEQGEFLKIIKKDYDLIYPLYINYKAKLRSANQGKDSWKKAVEVEIAQLEEYMARKKVGEEIK